jgi:hypothetical protein
MYYVEKRRKRQRRDGEKKIEDEVMLGGQVQMGEHISDKKGRIERGKEDRRKARKYGEERIEKRIIGNNNDR